MSLDKIKSVFENTGECEAWSLQLLRIQNLKNLGTVYAAVSVTLTPQGKLTELVKEISEHYVETEKGALNSFSRVQDYDGTTDSDVIYRLSAQSPLIAEQYKTFVTALANVDYEADPLSQRLQAYVIQGTLKVDGNDVGVKLISMQNPITTLKHKFLYERNTFKEIGTSVLSLRSSIDVLILGSEIYFFTMAGEKLFNMERAYKSVCNNKIAIITQSRILSDSTVFESIARASYHPRMFVSFNENRFKRLKNKAARKQYAELFDIPLKDGLFDTSLPASSDKLVKLLCNKGMVDPFENSPVEVSGARAWK